MLKIKGKVYVRVREKEAKSLTRKEKSSVHHLFFWNLKSAILVKGKGPFNLGSCFKKGRKQTPTEHKKSAGT